MVLQIFCHRVINLKELVLINTYFTSILLIYPVDAWPYPLVRELISKVARMLVTHRSDVLPGFDHAYCFLVSQSAVFHRLLLIFILLALVLCCHFSLLWRFVQQERLELCCLPYVILCMCQECLK
jgi:hypothetical protein